MMKAIKNFMNKPVTWGDSFKWSGIVLGLYAAVIGACVAYEKWTDYKAEKEMLKKMQESNLEDTPHQPSDERGHSRAPGSTVRPGECYQCVGCDTQGHPLRGRERPEADV